ncbi:MAG: potassium-transporting ATPase subunit KdpC [Euryarchaeota archaeon]|nr:potassium-transporting ATPase subunit KdpC [Euryarchaeota archaeon]
MADNRKEKKGNEQTAELSWLQHFGVGMRILLVFILVCSVLYPLIATGIGSSLWEDNAEGSPVYYNEEKIGSHLIGQEYSSDHYFHSRPSSIHYDATQSGSQNLGPTNEALTERANERLKRLQDQGVHNEKVPVSFVTESGSALDPHISPESAYLQIPRIAHATGIPEDELRELVEKHVEGKFLGVFGQRRVNVTLLNRDLQKKLEEYHE